MNNRVKSIDVAKGIGIILVMYAHICEIEPFLTIIYSFHMPLFFVISGLTFNQNKYNSLIELLRSKKELLIKYLFYSFLGVVLHLLYFVLIGNYDDAIILLKNGLISIFWASSSLKYFNTFNTPMWFIPCLLVTICILYLVEKIKNNHYKLLTVIAIVFVGWLTETAYLPIDFSFLPFNLPSACFAVGFMYLGHRFSKEIQQFFNKQKTTKNVSISILLTVVLLPLVVKLAQLNGKVSIGSRILNNGLLFYATGILGTIMIFLLSYILSQSKLLDYCGIHSLTIMGIHYLLYYCISKVFSILMDNNIIPQMNYDLLCFVFVFIFSIAIVKIIELVKEKFKKSINE